MTTWDDPRNFDCPESEAPCADKRCSKEHCVSREKARVAAAEAAVNHGRQSDSDLEREILPMLRAFLIKRGKNPD
jgi:hypothetical protein